ncbi:MULTISPECIES: alpha/beta fold hydrolase [Gammaproteobacteria]|uniref:alpha/beta fold hydrolase n=1 Tax=Gammaproteobacteria TaxID=1236 RepID=UPI000DD09FF3|nr:MULTISPECIES: alpha/beta fold hydrolase [Gammaproteobacteria]RTE85874.1 alpha/beta fold hydrolase [Aliidiomarina sp. B3213]TCZ90125.1 alpha/beta fold hydrolase [Lysobacter sp. N42]
MDKAALQQQLNAWLEARPADTDSAWLDWAKTDLAAFWQRTEHLEFNGKHDKRIAYGVWPQLEPSPWVVISPGRIESYIKYQEVALEWAATGYSVALIDHRGQGFSERLTDHHEHGHVDHFIDYVDDFTTWMSELEPRIQGQPCYLVAHSMGGAIASLYMAQYGRAKVPFQFKAAILSAPMMGINTKPWPESLGKAIVRFGAKVKRSVAPNSAHYFIGMKDYDPLPFAKNDLTHSANRYSWLTGMYKEHPRIRLGGPTWQWLTESLNAMDILPRMARKISTPILLMQGSDDVVVMPEAQDRFIANCDNEHTRLVKIDGARHEILMETDDVRNRAMSEVTAFLESLPTALAEE